MFWDTNVTLAHPQVHRALADIPKLYIANKREDLPKRVFVMVDTELQRIKDIDLNPLPKDYEQHGWGKQQVAANTLPSPSTRSEGAAVVAAPGSLNGLRSFKNRMNMTKKLRRQTTEPVTAVEMSVLTAADAEHIHFKRSVIQSYLVVESVAASIPRPTARASPVLEEADGEPIHDLLSSSSSLETYARPPWQTIDDYMCALSEWFHIDGRLVQFFLDGYRRARYSEQELTATEYRDIIKCVVIIVKRIKSYG